MKKAKPQTVAVPALSDLVGLVGETVRVVSRFAGEEVTYDVVTLVSIGKSADKGIPCLRLESGVKTWKIRRPFTPLVTRDYEAARRCFVPLTGLVSIHPILKGGKEDLSRGWAVGGQNAAT